MSHYQAAIQGVNPEQLVEISEQAKEQLDQYRARIIGRIEDADKTMETEVIAIGQAIDTIVREAQSQSEEMEGTIQNISGGQGGGLTGAITRQTQVASEYLGDISGQISEQDDAARKALKQCSNISSAGDTINDLVRTSKMLALNAMIEASRLGDQGRSFMVIATEMKTLSETIDETNGLVGELTTTLSHLLPQIVRQNQMMQERSQKFADALNEQISKLEEAREEMQEAITESLHNSDERINRILKASQGALSHLQFQDPTIQSLRRIDQYIGEFEETLIALLGLHTELDESRYMLNLGDEMGASQDELSMENGEVMLF